MINSKDWEGIGSFLRSTLEDRWPHGADGIWVALDDNDKEGDWRDYYTRQPMNSTPPWLESEPNGDKLENCASIISGTELWYDDRCDRVDRACMCDRQNLPYLRLRGLCLHSALDTHYQPMNNLTAFTKLKLVGFRTTIEYDSKRLVWALTIREHDATGISKASHASFTLGRQSWTIIGDMGCSIDGKEYTTELKMSGCQEGKFTCNDGQCVSMEQRCDQLPDCRDKSDERGCSILVLEQGYNKNVPPILSLEGRKHRVNVSTSIDLLKLVSINEKDYSIEIQFSIILSWIENRATFQNLKPDKTLNALTQTDIEGLWLPRVVYQNTDQKSTTRLGEFGNGEWETRVVVDRKGNFTRSGLDAVDEVEIFKGVQNNLIMTQTYTHEFQCVYNFSLYPFDTQVKYFVIIL